MKRLFLILFVFLAMTSFAQLQVKEGSFKHIQGGVIEDKAEYTDGNDLPMALVKIHTENICEQERLRLVFSGNRATQIIKKPKTGQMWIYVSAEVATFVEIRHPDYGVCKYFFPEYLCDYCVYEMVLQYVPMVESAESVRPQNTYLIIASDQDDAMIYIDDKFAGVKEASKSFAKGTSHTWRIECGMYHSESGVVELNEKTVINKKLRPNYGYINVMSYPENGASVFVDGEYIGVTPCKTDRLKSGQHSVKVMKEMYDSNEHTFVVTDGQTTEALVSMKVNYVILTVTSDSESDIYVDEEFKARGTWTGRVSDGAHYIEARKKSHETVAKNISLTLGKNEMIKLESPKPIYGYMDVNTNPIMADIYIDGKHYGQTPSVINDLLVGEHELRLHKDGYSFFAKKININKGETLSLEETLDAGRELVIVSDVAGDSVYVDGFYVGVSPMKMNVSYGMHDFTAVRNNKTLVHTISVGGDCEKVRLMFNEVNGHEYVDLGLPSGLKWAACNIGADKAEDYGDYFAWGEVNAKLKYGYGSNYKKCTEKDISGSVRYDAARANWKSGWRMPTKDELQELIDKCAWEWSAQNGIYGYKITGPNGKSIFLPSGGSDTGYGVMLSGHDGCYWTSTFEERSYSGYVNYLDFSNYNYKISEYGNGYYGMTIRPVCSSVEYVEGVYLDYVREQHTGERVENSEEYDFYYYDDYDYEYPDFDFQPVNFDGFSLSAFAGVAMGICFDTNSEYYGTDNSAAFPFVKAIGLECGLLDGDDYKVFVNTMFYLPKNERDAVSFVIGASSMGIRYGVGFCAAEYYSAPSSYNNTQKSYTIDAFALGGLVGLNHKLNNGGLFSMDYAVFVLGNHIFMDLRLGIGLKWNKKKE
ncbi:MAG: PEGA domain-containing protein [Bacteroidales bacterium]|nr:PEGA domain-containing protein [Bacteroidales bacterium]